MWGIDVTLITSVQTIIVIIGCKAGVVGCIGCTDDIMFVSPLMLRCLLPGKNPLGCIYTKTWRAMISCLALLVLSDCVRLSALRRDNDRLSNSAVLAFEGSRPPRSDTRRLQQMAPALCPQSTLLYLHKHTS